MSARQAEVVRALLDDSDAPPTYLVVAEGLGIHMGTVYRHLGRLRAAAPDLYRAAMPARRRQLDVCHAIVLC